MIIPWNRLQFGSWKGQDAYVVGTGPSARLFDPAFFRFRNVIGLNAAYQFCSPTLAVTIHPQEYFVPALAHPAGSDCTWVTKPKGEVTREVLQSAPVNVAVVSTTEELQHIGKQDAPLFVGRGIHQSGVDLAIRMGARAIFLVGIDMGTLGEQHHATPQHVRFHGLPPADVYREYREWMAAVRCHVRKTYGIPILSLSPLLGVQPEEDYARLCKELQLNKLPKAQDTSGYRRAKTDPPPRG